MSQQAGHHLRLSIFSTSAAHVSLAPYPAMRLLPYLPAGPSSLPISQPYLFRWISTPSLTSGTPDSTTTVDFHLSWPRGTNCGHLLCPRSQGQCWLRIWPLPICIMAALSQGSSPASSGEAPDTPHRSVGGWTLSLPRARLLPFTSCPWDKRWSFISAPSAVLSRAPCCCLLGPLLHQTPLPLPDAQAFRGVPPGCAHHPMHLCLRPALRILENLLPHGATPANSCFNPPYLC